MRGRTILGLLALFATLPFAAASNDLVDEGSSIQGRALLFDLTRFDPDLAAVAGLASAKTAWFGGAVTFDKGSDGWIYATTAGAGDPSRENLLPTGRWFNFTDSNGAFWSVQEWTYLEVRDVQYRLGDDTAVERVGHQVYVWTVKTSAKPVRDDGLGLRYNFVVVVDTGKLGFRPLGEDLQPDGAPVFPDESRSGEIDLHFTRSAPRARCTTCAS